jgi:GAF domain-containing protein
VIAGRAALALDARGVDAALLLEDGERTATARLVAAAGLAAPGERVAINYLGRRGLPTLSAIEVARGGIPGESFAGKLVVLGLTAQPFAGLVPTPVGALAPAQVQAHALSSVSDGVAWSGVPELPRWLGIALLAALVMIALQHLAAIGGLVTTAAVALGLVTADYLLFSAGATRLGATLPIAAVLAASMIERLHERIVIRRHAKEIALWTRRWMQLDSMRTDVPDDEPGYWLRVAGLARLYLGCTSTIVAELPPKSFHLKLRVINGTNARQIAERRRDVRRSPYRKAHLTLGPVWHDRFMADDQATLLVPLVVRSQLRGFWIVSFPTRELVAAPHMALIKTLAREIAMALDRRRAQASPPRPPGLVREVLGAGRFSLDLEEVRRAFDAHTQDQQDLLTLGESLPFGVFVATLWGEIRYMNTAMKLLCKHEGLDPASTSNGLPDVLSRLTGFPVGEVHQHLRKLVQELEELHVRGRDRIDRAGRDFVLSWLKPSASDPADAEQLLVVCALPPRAASRADAGPRPRPEAPSADDHAVTAPRLKVDLDAGGGSPLQLLAHGTPTFSSDLALAADGGARRMPFVPEATLPLGAGADPRPSRSGGAASGGPCEVDHDEVPRDVTFVVAGAAGRRSRVLPPMVSPRSKRPPDDPP